MKNRAIILLSLISITACSTNNISTPSSKPTATASAINQETSDSSEWWQKITPEEKKKLEDEEKLKENAGIKLSEPIILALEKYFSKEGKYPEKLEQLKPEYLENVVIKDSTYEIELLYKPDETSKKYELAFNYTGFGICSRSYTNEDKKWTGGCIL